MSSQRPSEKYDEDYDRKSRDRRSHHRHRDYSPDRHHRSERKSYHRNERSYRDYRDRDEKDRDLKDKDKERDLGPDMQLYGKRAAEVKLE